MRYLSPLFGRFTSCLQVFPLVPVDARLPQEIREQAATNVTLMRIRYTNGHIALLHDLMLCASIRTFKSELPQISDQIAPFDRA
jgi:hypothetical protein